MHFTSSRSDVSLALSALSIYPSGIFVFFNRKQTSCQSMESYSGVPSLATNSSMGRLIASTRWPVLMMSIRPRHFKVDGIYYLTASITKATSVAKLLFLDAEVFFQWDISALQACWTRFTMSSSFIMTLRNARRKTRVRCESKLGLRCFRERSGGSGCEQHALLNGESSS